MQSKVRQEKKAKRHHAIRSTANRKGQREAQGNAKQERAAELSNAMQH